MTLLPEELNAVAWAVQAAWSVSVRGREEGRAMPEIPKASQMVRSLQEDALSEDDRNQLMASLRFAISLWSPEMDDIRVLLQPPELKVLKAVQMKLSQVH